MKSSFLLPALLILLAASGLAQQVQRLAPSELSALDQAPSGTAVTTSPSAPALPNGFVSKGIHISREPERQEVKREYLSNGSVVAKSAGAHPNTVRIDYADKTYIEQSLVEVPLLFRVRTAELLNGQNLVAVVTKMREVLRNNPEARFRVEGHASPEGDLTLNDTLAKDRAETIRQVLANELSSNAIRAEGRGVKDARSKADSPELLLQQDRRVLVVREK